MGRASHLVLGLLSLAMLSSSPVSAQGVATTGAQEEANKSVIVVQPTATHIQVDLGPGLLRAVGHVEATVDGRLLRCDNLVAWLDLERMGQKPTDPSLVPPPLPSNPSILPDKVNQQLAQAGEWVKEVYAEGTVIFEQDGEFLRCDRLYLDLRSGRGLAVDATMSLPLSTRDGPMSLVAKAEELRILSRDRVQAVGVTTRLGGSPEPWTHVTSDRIELVKEPSSVLNDPDPNRPENYHVESEGNVLRVGSIPVLWLPDFVGDSASRRNALLIQSVRVTRSREFGTQLGVSLGDDLEQSDGRRFGNWRVDADWYSRRGPGFGVDLGYDRGEYRGIFFGRYQRDHGTDENFGDPPTKNRGRLSWWHRHRLPEDFQLDLELQLLSDRGYLPTWFEDDDKELKPAENLVYLKKVFFNSMVSGIVTDRFNDWFTRVEYQPELRFDLVAEPLADLFDHPVYLSVTSRAGHARIQYDEDLKIPARGLFRADVDSLVEYAFPLGPLKVTPFGGVRYSWFEEDRSENRSVDRVGFTFGATVNLQAWKMFDAQGGLFRLDGLRHVFIPELTFRNTVGVNVTPDELVPLDDVEALADRQVVELRVRNLLQTRRLRGSEITVDTFLDLEIEVPYFPNPGDNGGEPWGNLSADLLLRFRDDLQLVSDLEANWYGRGLEVANVAVGYTPSRDLQLYSGFRHFEGVYDAVFVQANWRIDEKWLITGETAYDFNEERGIDHRFLVSRIGPEWVIQLGLRADLGEDDFSVLFSVEPRFLFDPVLRPGRLQAEPRLLYLGSGLGL